jgi:hypothetical protein
MLYQVDTEGYSNMLIQVIVDYQKDDGTAVPKSEKWIVTYRGERLLRKSTVEWKRLVQWKNGSETWVL